MPLELKGGNSQAMTSAYVPGMLELAQRDGAVLPRWAAQVTKIEDAGKLTLQQLAQQVQSPPQRQGEPIIYGTLALTGDQIDGLNREVGCNACVPLKQICRCGALGLWYQSK